MFNEVKLEFTHIVPMDQELQYVDIYYQDEPIIGLIKYDGSDAVIISFYDESVQRQFAADDIAMLIERGKGKMIWD